MARKEIIGTAIFLVVLAMIVCSCAPNQRIVESNGQWVNGEANRLAAPIRSSLEREIEAMRTADFVFVYVIKRKDRGPLDAEDRQFASAVIPGEMNRRTLADEGKAILIGSNFRMPDESRKLIAERFTFEDLSSEVPPSSYSNANAQVNR